MADTDDLPSQRPSAGQLERVYAAAVAVAGAHDVDAALQVIVDSAREITQAEFGALGVPGDPNEPMAHFVVAGVTPEMAARAGRPPMGRGVLGVLLADGQTVRLANLADHPAYRGYPEHHPHVRSFLGVPVRAGGEIVGDLYLANKIGDAVFDIIDQRLIEMMATHAAVVIQNLRYQQKTNELVRLHEREALGRRLQDDVLQAMYGSGLVLGNIDLENRDDIASKLAEVQANLGSAIDHLRAHLLELNQPTHKKSPAR